MEMFLSFLYFASLQISNDRLTKTHTKDIHLRLFPLPNNCLSWNYEEHIQRVLKNDSITMAVAYVNENCSHFLQVNRNQNTFTTDSFMTTIPFNNYSLRKSNVYAIKRTTFAGLTRKRRTMPQVLF